MCTRSRAPGFVVGSFLALAVAMHPATNAQTEEERVLEKKSEESVLTLELLASSRIEEALATEQSVPPGPEWEPSHKETKVIEVLEGDDGLTLRAFCLSRDGNILACCHRTKWPPVSAGGCDGARAPALGEIRVLSPEGKLLKTWELSLPPQAIAVREDGTVFVGGEKIPAGGDTRKGGGDGRTECDGVWPLDWPRRTRRAGPAGDVPARA